MPEAHSFLSKITMLDVGGWEEMKWQSSCFSKIHSWSFLSLAKPSLVVSVVDRPGSQNHIRHKEVLSWGLINTWNLYPWVLWSLHYLHHVKINTPFALERDWRTAPLQCGSQIDSTSVSGLGSSKDTCPKAGSSTRTRTSALAWWNQPIQPRQLHTALSASGTGQQDCIERGQLGHPLMPHLFLATISHTVLGPGNRMMNWNRCSSCLGLL